MWALPPPRPNDQVTMCCSEGPPSEPHMQAAGRSLPELCSAQPSRTCQLCSTAAEESMLS